MKATNPLAVMRLVEAYVDARVFAAHGREKPGLIDATREDVETALLALGGNTDRTQAMQIGQESRLVVFYDRTLAADGRARARDALSGAFGGVRVIVLDGGARLGVVSPEKPADA